LKNEGVPDSFEFKGSAIFITNIKFDNVKSKKLRDHLEALESRCHYIDLTIDSERDKILRIKQITKDGMLDAYEFEDGMSDDILEFIETNKKRLRELSLRTVLKVADLAKAFPDRWEAMAENTVMKRG
jgi:Trk K+ transport system NAD-binding subunit